MLNFDARVKNSDAAQLRVTNVKTPIPGVSRSHKFVIASHTSEENHSSKDLIQNVFFLAVGTQRNHQRKMVFNMYLVSAKAKPKGNY